MPRARPCVRGVVCVCQGHTLPEARCVSLRFMDHAPRPLRLLRENLGSDPRSGPGQAQARRGPRTRPSSPALPGLSLCSGPGTAGARRRPEARGAGEGAGARRPVSRKQERGLEIGKAEAKPIWKEIDVKPRDKITLNEIKKEIYQRHQRCSSEYGPGKGNAEEALRGEGRGRGGGGGGRGDGGGATGRGRWGPGSPPPSRSGPGSDEKSRGKVPDPSLLLATRTQRVP